MRLNGMKIPMKTKKSTTTSTKNTFAQSHQSLYWRRISLYEWQKKVQVKLNQPSWASDVHFDSIFFYFIFYLHFLVMMLLLLLLLILRWKLCVQDKCSAEQPQKNPYIVNIERMNKWTWITNQQHLQYLRRVP